MAAEGDSEHTYVLKVKHVRHAVDALLARDTHPFFIAYLWLRREAGRQGTTEELRPNWSDLGRFLAVEGGPPGKPYLRPFWKGERNANQEWLNRNLAGSFAPSSFRGVPRQVIEPNADGSYRLRDEHWNRALEFLLYGEPLPAAAVAAFMLRNRGFVSPAPPTHADFVMQFVAEFGYREEPIEFGVVFDASWGSDIDWFELLLTEGVDQ